MSPNEIEQIAEAIADRVADRLASRPAGEGLLDVHQVAELLGCSVPTVERLTSRGNIPSLLVGRLRRYRLDDVMSQLKKKGE
jgi:excisionase family DNA binding protein